MPLPPNLQAQIDELAFYEDRSDRIQALIEIGEEFTNPGSDIVPRGAENRVPGCESEVYVASQPLGQGRKYLFAVDNPQGISAMALARILEQGLNGAPLSQVNEVSEDIVYTIFGRELSMGKSLGLTGMVRMAKLEAAKSS